MNMKAMMQQVQQMQKEMLKEQEKIGEKIFEETTSLVDIEANGKKEITKINIKVDDLDSDDLEMLEDMLLVAVNNVMKKIDQETEEKLGKYTKGLPGLF